MKRGILCVADLRARSVIDPQDRNPYDPCWRWARAVNRRDGAPRIYTFDHERGEKRPMSGPKAVWNISRGQGPAGRLVYRTCFSRRCVNPAHHALAHDMAAVNRLAAQAGSRKGRALASKAASLEKARAARGQVSTPWAVVQAVRSADAGVSGQALASMYGISQQTVSRIRRGRRRAAP